MNLKMIMCAFLVLRFALPVIADSPAAVQKERLAEFKLLVKQDDQPAALKLLQEWQAKSPSDVELAVAWANYYGDQARRAEFLISASGKESASDESALSIIDPKTNQPVGFLGLQTHYNEELLSKSLTVLLDAATTHPERTDIWMGAIHTHLLAGDFEDGFVTLRKFATYARENPEKLRGALGAPLEEKAEEFMPKTLHVYAVQAFEEETTAGRSFLLNVAKLAQQHYPGHPYAYNDEAAYHNYLMDDAKVLDCLMRAHKIRPRDALVTFNIASTYRNLKDLAKMREYLELTIKLTDDEELKAAAQEQLDSL